MSMNNELFQRVDAYLLQHLIPPDPVLDAVLDANEAAGLPHIDVSPHQGKFLHLLARLMQARRILEIGTLGGYSTICLARALPADGRLLTLELEPHHAEVARTNVARAGLSSLVEIRVGPAMTTLEGLTGEIFDLIFIDADKDSYPEYVAQALRLSRRGTAIVCDNVVRKGAIVDSGRTDPRVAGVRRMFEQISGDPRLDATTLQTVGSKGYDGLLIAIVNEPDTIAK